MNRWRKLVTAGIAVVALFVLLDSPRADSIERIDGSLFGAAISAVARHYIDPSRIVPQKMLDESMKALQKRVPEILVKKEKENLDVTVGLAQKKFKVLPVESVDSLARVLAEITDFISANYTGDLKPEDIVTAMMDGLTNALDPHSNYLPKKVFDEFKVGTRGKFGGLGIVISIKDGLLTVVAPIEETPASRAGIRAGDRIQQIGDESTINMSLTDAVNKLRGEPGTEVSIIIEREGHAPKKIAMKRAIINIESVKSGLLVEDGKRLGYLKIKNFQSNTMKDVKSALASFHKDGAALDGLILDVRNNPGGLLNVSVEMADLFLEEGAIVSTVGRNGEILDLESARKNGTEPTYPIVVMINEGSASASEIVAGALQQHGRAVVIGNESFGKGTVQTVFELGDDTALKLTIATYKPADRESIQLAGIMPDIELIPTTVDHEKMNLYRDKLISEEDLEKPLDGRAKKETKRKAKYEVHFLKAAEKEDDVEKESREEYSKKLFIEDDFAVNFAKKLVARAGKTTRDETLDAAKKVVEDESKAEDKKVVAALSALGVNWQATPAAGKPSLQLSYQMEKDGKKIERARAGDKVDVEVTAKNTGSGPFARLAAVGQNEDMAFLSNREFIFGLIPPGESRTWRTKLEMPMALPTENLKMELGFEEQNGNAPAKMKMELPVEALPDTSYSMKYELPANIKGKPFRPGASIPFDVTVANAGPGISSEETALTLSDECDGKIFVENGRMKIGSVAKAKPAVAKFRFHMLDGFDASKCAMFLTIADQKRLDVYSQRITVAPATGVIDPAPGTPLAPPAISISQYPAKVQAESVEIKGTITAPDSVKDYYVFAGEEKIAYGTNPTKSQSVEFKVVVPLKEGDNRVIVGARSATGIAGSKVIAVERAKQ